MGQVMSVGETEMRPLGFQWFPVARSFGLLFDPWHPMMKRPVFGSDELLQLCTSKRSHLQVWKRAQMHLAESGRPQSLGAKTCVLFGNFRWRLEILAFISSLTKFMAKGLKISGSLGQSTRKAYVPAYYFILEELSSSLSELVASLEYPWIGPPDRRPISERMFLVISCHLHRSTFAKRRCHREHRTHVTAVTAEIPRRLLLPRPPGEVAGKDDLHPSETS